MSTITTLAQLDSGSTSRSVINTNFANLNTDKIDSNSPTITTPKIVTSINDTNGNEMIKFSPTASAVDELTITNSATGLSPNVQLTATGDDSNIILTLSSKGTGEVRIGSSTSQGIKLLGDQPINDSSGNELIKFSKTASAVNEVTITNNSTGTTGPLISATGETNVDLRLGASGSGKIVPTASVNFGAKTAYFTETDNGNSSTADTIDWTVSNKQRSTLTGNCTFTFTAPPGPCSLILKLIQDGTGSRTVTWPAAVHWSGASAPTLTTTANRVDIICFYYDGTTYFGTSALNFVA